MVIARFGKSRYLVREGKVFIELVNAKPADSIYHSHTIAIYYHYYLAQKLILILTSHGGHTAKST